MYVLRRLRGLSLAVALLPVGCNDEYAAAVGETEDVDIAPASTLADAYTCEPDTGSLSGVAPHRRLDELTAEDAIRLCGWMRTTLEQSGEPEVQCEHGMRRVSVRDDCEVILRTIATCDAATCLLENCNLLALLDPCASPDPACLELATCE